MDLKSKIILIAGPTASGKSEFAIKLANKINGEIINADSMQVYKQLQVLTARPSMQEQKKIKHHLYGFQSVTKKFSTGVWLKLVVKKINEIQKKNKIPIFVGGTGLYFKALTEGLVKMPNIPMKIRNKIILIQKKLGQKNFYKKLIKLDPLIKSRINSNDVQRSIRAYEIKKYTKISMAKWFKRTKVLFDQDRFVKLYINFPRAELIKGINKRVDRMFEQGAIKEVKKFNRLKVRKENSANNVIGIKEITNYLSGENSLSDAKEQIAIKTRQYAKRQTTWARGNMISWQNVEHKNLNSALNNFK
ncbi:MAG: tRNA (adenosine(37)-N6)-dimethylallyltransferase MiaA [Candidatus Pelagibacter sp.]|jgi:tRNA dimethylallyltransferase|nr:tRNA (adenosine(37)-N6)-dimethylallyltransferase MiaA [Candidatus Pelagibacter sp.]|tara:strand:+ start:221 stop:1132 length:912 start_codon:yes stop_codon:yes gene_type:complete